MNTLLAALAELPAATRNLYIAYSGGRDSTALLHALRQAHPGRALRALHVCHHLEAEAEAWAAHCARAAARLDVVCDRIDVRVDTVAGGVEGGAREARYAALAARLGEGDVLVCAQHRRDQAETFLLAALRGSGVAGLAAMPRLAPLGQGRLWRPWLAIDRDAITAYARVAGLGWVEDGSNSDPRRARGYLRQRLWPLLRTRWPAVEATLARSAAWAGEAAQAVAALAEIDLARARAADGSVAIAALAELSQARAGAALRHWLAEQGADRPDHRHLAQLMRLLSVREHASPRLRFAATEVRRFDGRLYRLPLLAPAPAPGTQLTWPAPEPLALPADCGCLAVTLPRSADWPDGVQVGFRRGGERLVRGDGRHTPLAEWLRGARTPPWIRERLPLIFVGDTLLAVPGHWRHPTLARWFGGVAPHFDWQHALPGEPPRVVACPPFG